MGARSTLDSRKNIANSFADKNVSLSVVRSGGRPRRQSVWEAAEQLAHHSHRRNVKNDLAGLRLVELRKKLLR